MHRSIELETRVKMLERELLQAEQLATRAEQQAENDRRTCQRMEAALDKAERERDSAKKLALQELEQRSNAVEKKVVVALLQVEASKQEASSFQQRTVAAELQIKELQALILQQQAAFVLDKQAAQEAEKRALDAEKETEMFELKAVQAVLRLHQVQRALKSAECKIFGLEQEIMHICHVPLETLD